MEILQMPFIYSTLTCSNSFVVYATKTDPKALSRIVKRIEIHGGHGMKNPQALDTPMGVVTKVTDEELKLLEENLSFRKQIASGFIVVDNKKVEPALKAADMSLKDASAPMTPKDFEKSDISDEATPVYKKKGR